MASILRFVLAFAALLPGVAAVHLRRTVDKPSEPADSKIVEGPDCGHVKQIISKYTKASKVGTLAGKAQGAINSAEAAADVAEAAKTQAEEIGGAFKDKDGELPVAIQSALKNAGDAGDEAMELAGKLETKLSSFKDKITKTDFSGAGVGDGDMVMLKDMTVAVGKAAETAREVAAATVKKAEEVKADYLKDASSMGKFAKEVLDAANAAVAEASDIGQKAGYAVDDGELLGKKAKKATTGLKAKLAEDESDQAPVLEAFIDDLDRKATGVSDVSDEAVTAIKKLETDATTLKDSVATTKGIYEAVRGGANTPSGASGDLTTAEAATDAVEQDIVEVKGLAKTLMARMAKLKAKVAEAEKKLPPPGPEA